MSNRNETGDTKTPATFGTLLGRRLDALHQVRGTLGLPPEALRLLEPFLVGR